MKKGTRRFISHGVRLLFEGTCRSARAKQQLPPRVPRSSPAACTHHVCSQRGTKRAGAHRRLGCVQRTDSHGAPRILTSPTLTSSPLPLRGAGEQSQAGLGPLPAEKRLRPAIPNSSSTKHNFPALPSPPQIPTTRTTAHLYHPMLGFVFPQRMKEAKKHHGLDFFFLFQ